MVSKARLWLVCAATLSYVASAWAGPMIAVTSQDQGAVLFFNVIGGGAFLTQKASVHVGEHPGEMCLAPDQKQLYVNTSGEKGAVVIDIATQTVTGTLKAPGMDSPDSCVVSPDSRRVYVVDPAAQAIFVFSADTKQLETKIQVGKEPRRVIFTPDGKKLLVSNSQANTLSVIDAEHNSVIRTIKTGNEPRDMVFSPDGKLLAVTLIDDDSVEFFKGDTLEFKEQVGAIRSPQHLGFTPDSERLYIVGKLTDEVAVMHIGSHSRVDFTIPVNPGSLGALGSWGFAMTPDVRYLYVTNLNAGTISIIDTHSMKPYRAFLAGKSATDVVYIKPNGGAAGLNANARLDYYRSLAKQAVEAVTKSDFAGATKLAKDLEQQWDDNESALRKTSPELWGQVDEAMDDFIHPIIHADGNVPPADKLNPVYKTFLDKLALVH